MASPVGAIAGHSSPVVDGVDPALLELLRTELTTDEQHLFIDSFALYLQHDKRKDFVIDLDDVWQWMGFSNKGHAKRATVKNLQQDVDFSVIARDGNKSLMDGSSMGRPVECIRMTQNGFKKLCMRVGTERGSQVSEYYLAMEEVMFEYLQQSLTSKQAELEDKSMELEAARNVLETLQMAISPECDGYLYSFHTDIAREEAHRKIGITTWLKSRHGDHGQTNHCGAYDICREVPLGFGLKKAENTLRLYLDFAGHHISGENYLVSRNDIRYWITIITGLAHVGRKDAALRSKVLADIAVILDRDVFGAPTTAVSSVPVSAPVPVPAPVPEHDDVIIDEEEILAEAPVQVARSVDEYRFDQFISEMCVTSDINACAPTVLIAGAYRLWARSATKVAYHALLRYLGRRFRPVRVPSIVNCDNVMNGYEGVSLIPRLPRELPAMATMAQRFLHAEAEFAPHGKVLLTQLSDEYKNWLRRVRPDSPFSDADVVELRNELDRSNDALQSVLWTAQGNGIGFYGVHLRCNDAIVSRTTSSTAKAVEKYDTNTGQVLNRWTTIAKAAEMERIPSAKLSRMIKSGVCDENGVIYRRTG
jgi:hypothetical protein